MYDLCSDCQKRIPSWQPYCPYCSGENRMKAMPEAPKTAARKARTRFALVNRILGLLKPL